MSYSSLKTNVGIAVDLDNTMIGSASQSYNYPEEVQVVDRSLYTGAEIYISQKALDVYKYLSKQSRLIAVTTRSSSQFLRMTIAEHTKCAIFDNGATIMFDGKVD